MTAIDRLSPDRIAAEWHRIGPLLAPAIAHDDKRTVEHAFADLITGKLVAFDVEVVGAHGVVVTETALAVNGQRCCWVVYIGGRISGDRRQWLGRTRMLMRYFEQLAKQDGCTEMRVEGRNWARVLTDYDALTDRPGRNELRKAL